MSSTERLLLAGIPHHLLRKSPRGERVFQDKTDYRYCLGLIQELKDEYQLDLHAWCILPDRVHLIVTPRNLPQDLSTFMKAFTCRTSLRRRGLHGKGSPWDPRLRSSPIEPGQWLMACMCYVERLPVMLKMAGAAYHYEHSSYRMRLGKTDHYWLDDAEEYERLGESIEERAEAYRVYMRNGLDEKEVKLIDTALHRNRLTGSKRFAEYVYRRFGFMAVNRGPGRPPKRKKKKKKDPTSADY